MHPRLCKWLSHVSGYGWVITRQFLKIFQIIYNEVLLPRDTEPDGTEADRSLFLHPSPLQPLNHHHKIGSPPPTAPWVEIFPWCWGEKGKWLGNKAGIDLKHQLPNAYLVIVHIQIMSLLTCHFSCVQLFATPRTVTHQGPLSTGFSRQEY